MRRSILLLILIVASAAIAWGRTSPQVEGKTSQTVQEIVRLEKAWADAMKRRDARTLELILADDYRDTSSTGVIRNKAQELELLKTVNLTFISYEPDDIDVRIYSNVAVVTGHLMLKARFESQEASGELRYTRMYVKRRGRWQAVASQMSQIKE